MEVMLHHASSITNLFEFERAKDTMAKQFKKLIEAVQEKKSSAKKAATSDMIELVNKVNPVVLGLSLLGQVCSALGQYEAFLENPKVAGRLFDKAIGLFNKLSDEESKRREVDKTRTYEIIVAMDMCDGSSEAVRDFEEKLVLYLGGKKSDMLSKLAKRIATETDCDKIKEEQYHHHVLLRYFACDWAKEGAKYAYLQVKNQWNFLEEAHPWELISFYRGILFEKPEEWEREESACQKAIRICERNGFTLKVFGEIYATAINPSYSTGEKVVASLLKKRLGKETPSEIIDRLGKVKGALEILKKVLTFNFR